MNSKPVRRTLWRLLAASAVVAGLVYALVVWLNVRGETPLERGTAASDAAPFSAAVVAQGAYLARAGNCIGCHSTAGGAALAGGRGVETPFGVVFAPNITPDLQTGIGSWSAGEFWRALHHGRAKDGRLLYPAFPYPSFTHVTREDADAIYAYLFSTAPVAQQNRPHELRFPYSTQAALAVWRALYFRPNLGADAFAADPARSAAWNRGKYLVEGLGHCAACHSGRNFLGGTSLNREFAGGLMPDETWYAPSLSAPSEAGLQNWTTDEAVRLLRDGVSAQASVSGPMAEVVFSSTQFLTQQDLQAMVQFLSSMPVIEPERQPDRKPDAEPVQRAASTVLVRGEEIYEQHCASCHGAQGQGASNIYPALAGNRAVTLHSHHNVVQIIRRGGFMPTTAGNPRPFGMPPYGPLLNHEDIAAVASFIRQSWGNAAPAVSPLDVLRVR